MKILLPVVRTALLLAVVPLGLLLGQPLAAVVTFTVTPSSVSNQSTGAITLQIGGLTNSEKIAVDKYLDANTNGVIDATDWPVQSFRLTDGQVSVIGGATNINVPFDSTPADGSITTQVSFVTGGFGQQLVGQYIYRLSSPTGRFAPITAAFTVTSSAYAQSFTGNVVCNGSNVPYAGVMLFTPPSPGGEMSSVAGTVADSSGSYTLKAAPGTYLLWALQSNYVADVSATVLTLGPGATITTNLNLLPATRSVSGQFVDAANPSKGLRGILLALQSSNRQFMAIGFTDTNGNFNVGVTANNWQIGTDNQSVALHGYVELQDSLSVDTTTGSVAGVTNALPNATALFYGSVKDAQNHPLVGADVYGYDNNNQYQTDGTTDQNGNYAVAALGGQWWIQPDNSRYGFGSYMFSRANTNISDGQAILLNFVGTLATNQISGYVTDAITSSGIANVGVPASTTINGIFYNQYGRTDNNGYFSCNVASGTWYVAVNCGTCSDCLGNFGYQCPTNFSQFAGISNNNAVVNFTAQPVASFGDGIPDSWRQQFFGTSATTNNRSCAICDADGTGQINLFKYIAGLDPTNPASVFVLQIASVTGQPMQKNLIYKPIAGGRTYASQFVTNLVGAVWTNLTTISGPATNGNQVTVTDTQATQTQKFYRIHISLP